MKDIYKVKGPRPFNRLIIVGNGFDLAAGLRTGYKDMILYSHKKAIRETATNGTQKFENGMFSAQSNTLLTDIDKAVLEQELKECESILQLERIAKSVGVTYKIVSSFYQHIVEELHVNNWVDIESAYYNKLWKIFDEYQKRLSGNMELAMSNLKRLHYEFSSIETELDEYIRYEQTKFRYNHTEPGQLGELFLTAFTSLEGRPPVDRSKFLDAEKSPTNVLFLNFNYSGVIGELRRQHQNIQSTEIQIHGAVNSPSNPIVFGYGDDTSSEYREMERSEKDEFMERIKSNQYIRTANYHNLLAFLESGLYEVFIWGHSCGMSDKTLLSTIFEHNNCRAIKNFSHRGIEGDIKKGIAIARHFEDKKKMRARLLNHDPEAKMPSVK